MSLSVSHACVKILIFIFCTQDIRTSRVKRYLLESPSSSQNIDTGPYQWSSWTSWSDCNGTCQINGGIGNQTRTRFCGDGKDHVKLHFCQNPYTGHDDDALIVKRDKHSHDEIDKLYTEMESQTCEVKCVHDIWSDWQAWTPCSVSCGEGIRSRLRHCNGSGCTGNSSEVAICTEKICAMNGAWSVWTGFGECSHSCGKGVKFRTRQCNNPAPKYGGLNCTGKPHEITTCTKRACPIDGAWSMWTGFGDCSQSCGNGVKSRTRQCNNPFPQNGGLNCTGSPQEVAVCKTPACPIDGGWSGWTEFGQCSQSCGNGVVLRTRQCNFPVPKNGGVNCNGSSHEVKTCSKPACPIDGGWSGWTDFGECSRSCGNGVKFRTRQCNYPVPKNGGLNCTGKSEEFNACTKSACPLDGGWSAWTEFKECSHTCGNNGVQYRLRRCDNPRPQNGGLECTGFAQDFRPCAKGPCPINGGWGAWMESGECSKSCGGNGVQYRLRHCDNPRPQNGGHDCSGSAQGFSTCADKPCPQDGSWSPWGNWSDCSKTCGNGFHTRTRPCNNPAPKNGGSNCTGLNTEIGRCNLRDCTIDGFWGLWSNWSDCSYTCGNGTRTRTRLCNKPAPQNGGMNCTGLNEEINKCNLRECPIDGGWSEYRNMSCSVTCGKGTVLSVRACNNPVPQFGGKNCAGLLHQTYECDVFCAVKDGYWSTWSDWTNCNANCGNGTKTRTRLCDNPAPQNGGQYCNGTSKETQSCLLRHCPIDGDWSNFTAYTSCSVTCGRGQQISLRDCNNPSPQFGGKDCIGLSHQITECIKPPCAIDGSWGAWSNWTNCSASCGSGTHTRTRLCDSPAPQYGGQNCTGNNTETQLCHNKECPVDGGWSDYQNISCSVTCGRGQLISVRSCTNPSPQFGGKDCKGLSHRFTECHMSSCAIDGQWSNWSQFIKCGSVCGDGYTLRYRTCSSPTPQNGGKNCTGSSEQRLACNNGPCPPVG